MFVFDFDGVLIDSTPEIMVSAYNTVTSSLCTSEDELPESFREHFLKNRGYALNAADMVALAELIRTNQPALEALDRAALIEFRKSCGSVLKLQRALFASRAAFHRKDEQSWFAHNRPFTLLWQLLQQGHFKDFIIVTNKNRKAVQQICTHYDLALEDDRILSGDEGISKLSRVLTFLHMSPVERIVYFEDAVGNLEEIIHGLKETVDVQGLLVSWGALAPGDEERAASIGAQVIDLDRDVLLAIEQSA